MAAGSVAPVRRLRPFHRAARVACHDEDLSGTFLSEGPEPSSLGVATPIDEGGKSGRPQAFSAAPIECPTTLYAGEQCELGSESLDFGLKPLSTRREEALEVIGP